MIQVPPNAVAHASARLAQLILIVVGSDVDPRTLGDWASLCNLGYWTLRERCRCAAIAPRTALSFARVLRAVLLAERGVAITESLDIEDPRALRRMLAAAGVTSLTVRAPTLDEYLKTQRFVSRIDLLVEVRRQCGWSDAKINLYNDPESRPCSARPPRLSSRDIP
jgi:hypothetical protein